MKKIIVCLFALLPMTAMAGVVGKDLPADTVWYVHADLAGMRNSETGKGLYEWINGEVFVEINKEIGIDLNREVDRVTAFSATESGMVIVLEGDVSDMTRDKMIALATLEGDADFREYKGSDYYFVGDEARAPTVNDPFDDLDETIYFSFAVDGKLLVTSREAQLFELLENRGRIAGQGGHDGALFVLTADRSFVQAGLRTDRFADDDDDWDSNILRNTEQAAVVVADRNGLLAVQAELHSTDARMAQSISSVVNGLIGLQAFNGDLDPGVRDVIRNTRVSVSDAVLSISTVFDPALLLSMLSN